MKFKFVLLIVLLIFSCSVFAKQEVPREWAEWTRIWRNGANEIDKLHVLIIGDSISEQYFGIVNSKLSDGLYIDNLASSRSIDQDYFWKQLEMVIEDEDYSLICFNFGLHGGHLSLEDYYKGMDKYAKILKKTKAKIICISTTPLEPFKDDNKAINNFIDQKNAIAKKICNKYDFHYFDIYNLLIDKKGLHNENDDIHFNSEGIKIISDAITNEIVEIYNSSK